MESKPAPRTDQRQGGFALVAITALVTVLMATGLAFMRWNVDEAVQSAQATAAMQAYYLGQLGIVEQGFQYLRKLPAAQLPTAQTDLYGRDVPGFGRYDNVKIFFLIPEGESGDFFSMEKKYKIVADGIVRVPYMERGIPSFKDIVRKAVLYVQVRNFADYMYLSNEEMTSFGDRIKFWHGDTLNGRVHSNSEIAVMENPVFYKTVSSTAEDFWHGSSFNPALLGTPPTKFNADTVKIPTVAENLRLGAASQGFYFSNPGMSYRATFNPGVVHLTWWPTGTPYDSTRFLLLPINGRTCIFIDGPLDVKGLVVGQVTIGCSQTMRILDNIRYADASPVDGRLPDLDNNGVPEGDNFLGLVAEGDIKVANTIENGRENAHGLGLNQTNPAFSSVVITAAVVALGESFTFEQQNDPDSGYVFAGNPDDRGTIYLFGSLTQMRRGYVHRSTKGSTGYLKQYRYDNRFLTVRPPCFFDAKDEHGRALFDVVQWGRGVPDQADVQHQVYEKFN